MPIGRIAGSNITGNSRTLNGETVYDLALTALDANGNAVAGNANTATKLLASLATTNPLSIKASSGNLSKIMGNNTVASKRYLKLYNKASAPTVGTDVPILTIPLLASAAFDINLHNFLFSAGIALAITGAAADADTTAIGAGDIECLNVLYA